MNVLRKTQINSAEAIHVPEALSARLNLDLLGAVTSQMETIVYPNFEPATTLKSARKVRDQAPRIL